MNNVDINFLFAKGQKLSQNLIDINRVHQIMLKIKELARNQALEGSKNIDYQQLVVFLHELDQRGDFDGNTDLDTDENEKWQQIIDFMRNNPKLLMQMIPDSDGIDFPDGVDLKNII